jgi:HPt (histidine-containing phosphotransfer) domain-containing protein
MTAPTIDLAAFEALQQTTGKEFVAELVVAFLAEAPIMLAELRRALAADDVAAFRRTAHSLKSNANTFGALTLGTMARDLELATQTTLPETSLEQVNALDQEYARAASSLAELTRA